MSSSLNEEQQVELFSAILPYLVLLTMAGLRLTRYILGSAFASTCTPLMPALMDVMPAQPGDGNELDFGTVCSTMQTIIVRTKLFIADQTNLKLIEVIIARLQDPSTHPCWMVPALWVAPALVGASPTTALAATRFLTVLRPLLNTTKMIQQQEQAIQSSLRLAAQNGTLVLDVLHRTRLDAMGIFFLGLVWNDPDTPTALRAAALNMAALLMTGKEVGWTIKFESSVIPLLLCSLTCQDLIIRHEAFAFLKVSH